ncbi:zinc transporter ZupT [Candidatus Peregrinibacteria bacterium]|nr:zinc transporter ZupT [bacterium]NCQ55797.1 zinc transporter ZupT [Candidatus Parcubacteria bacterium]NCS67864.1 zinc transporter ZupT [Candidatus Peregrinibacteria bacterium]
MVLDSTLLLAFGLTLFAGLATGVGSLLAFTASPTNHKFLSVSLGFSAGVMLYVSFVEIFVKARDSLSAATNDVTGYQLATLGFFVGIVFIALIDKLIDRDHGNPHEIHDPKEMDKEVQQKKSKLLRMGLFTALAIAIHNFPEGLATFLATIEDPSLGIAIAIAVAIHNVPEGIAVSIPIYHATGSRMKAFWYSFGSGIVEPIGALIGYFMLVQFFNDLVFGLVFAAVGGIMVFISLDQLLPTAQKYGEHHLSIYGLILGMAVMAMSLLLFL